MKLHSYFIIALVTVRYLQVLMYRSNPECPTTFEFDRAIDHKYTPTLSLSITYLVKLTSKVKAK